MENARDVKIVAKVAEAEKVTSLIKKATIGLFTGALLLALLIFTNSEVRIFSSEAETAIISAASASWAVIGALSFMLFPLTL